MVFRLPGVFGKWCRPHYNSVVATFCHNLARGLPIQVNDASASLKLVYVDDVVSAFIKALQSPAAGCVRAEVAPEYTITLGDLAQQIRAFADCRTNLMSERVGTGLVRALYATYVSYLPNERFAYEVPQHADARGVFVEMLKTADSGQFSYFTVTSPRWWIRSRAGRTTLPMWARMKWLSCSGPMRTLTGKTRTRWRVRWLWGDSLQRFPDGCHADVSV